MPGPGGKKVGIAMAMVMVMVFGGSSSSGSCLAPLPRKADAGSPWKEKNGGPRRSAGLAPTGALQPPRADLQGPRKVAELRLEVVELPRPPHRMRQNSQTAPNLASRRV